MTAPIANMMLIDDNEADTFLYSLIIEESGLVSNLKVFNSADTALQHLRDHGHVHFNAILLDIRMPRMSGFEFLEAAQAEFGPDFATTVVVMLTTSLDPADCARAEAFNVMHYLEKPLTREHLEEIAAMVAKVH